MLHNHVVPQVVCMDEDLLNTSCICCVGVWEQQYWPIGGSPDQGNYLKAYSHTLCGIPTDRDSKKSPLAFNHNLKPESNFFFGWIVEGKIP